MNNKEIRNYFPIFNNHALGNDFVYLDNSATTQKPQSVIDALVTFYTTYNANIQRGLYPIGEYATQKFEDVRRKVASFINACSSEEIIFTKGTTESINMVAHAWALQHLKPGDKILLTHAEHHANLLPWQHIARITGAQIDFIPINKQTHMLDYHDDLVTDRTRLVAVSTTSNVLGNIWHTKKGSCLHDLITRARCVGARVLLDSAQTMVHERVDVQLLDCDFLAFSGHKMFAPTGVGVLYVKKELHEELEPYQFGGGMVHSVSFDSAQWDKMPQKFEAGTPPISSVIGLGAALDFLMEKINFQDLQTYEAALCNKLLHGLADREGIVRAINPAIIDHNGHMISFTCNDIHPHDLADFLGREGIAVRAGHHCAQPLVNKLGYDALVRASFAAYNTEHDVDLFLAKLDQALSFFRRDMKKPRICL